MAIMLVIILILLITLSWYYTRRHLLNKTLTDLQKKIETYKIVKILKDTEVMPDGEKMVFYQILLQNIGRPAVKFDITPQWIGKLIFNRAGEDYETIITVYGQQEIKSLGTNGSYFKHICNGLGITI